jgi:HSP20 family protein
MMNAIYSPMTRLVHELNCRVNNMPRYVDEARAFARSYMPTVNVEFQNIILTPRVDALESDEKFTLLVELAGVAKEDVSVSIENGVLSIKGEKKRPENYNNDVKFLNRGRRFGQFERSFKLGENIDAAGITAEFSNGVLTLTLPKSKTPKAESTTIEIQ